MGAALYHSLYVIIGGALLPSAIMLICAYLIQRNLRQKQQRRIQLNVAEQRRHHLDQQVYRLLFIQVLFFVLFIIPQLANLLFNTISISILNRTDNHYTIERFLNIVAELMLYLFPVTSFYLYTLTSRTFRTELITCLKATFRTPQRIAPVTDATYVTHRM